MPESLHRRQKGIITVSTALLLLSLGQTPYFMESVQAQGPCLPCSGSPGRVVPSTIEGQSCMCSRAVAERLGIEGTIWVFPGTWAPCTPKNRADYGQVAAPPTATSIPPTTVPTPLLTETSVPTPTSRPDQEPKTTEPKRVDLGSYAYTGLGSIVAWEILKAVVRAKLKAKKK